MNLASAPKQYAQDNEAQTRRAIEQAITSLATQLQQAQVTIADHEARLKAAGL